LSTFLRQDEVGGARSKPQQRDIGVTHSDSRLIITQGDPKGSRLVEAAKVENFSIKVPMFKDPPPPSEGIKKPMVKDQIILIPGGDQNEQHQY
jgi:hypothetical protein